MIKNNKFIFIAGPCVIEDLKATLGIARNLKSLFAGTEVRLIFKASFDKANRTSLKSFRGPGLAKGIDILAEVKKRTGLEILSDVHTPAQVAALKGVLDVIQIPAFLCRQTDLLIEAAKSKKTVNVKKGQFLSPYDVTHIVEKINSAGNKKIFITERGTSFGYNNLVVDFRSFPIMKKLGYPVIFDVTHSLQLPSAEAGISGGQVQFVEPLGLAGIAAGCDGLFMEVHPQPFRARCDRHTSFKLSKMRNFVSKVLKLRKALGYPTLTCGECKK